MMTVMVFASSGLSSSSSSFAAATLSDDLASRSLHISIRQAIAATLLLSSIYASFFIIVLILPSKVEAPLTFVICFI